MTTYPKGTEIIKTFLSGIEQNELLSLHPSNDEMVLHFSFAEKNYVAYFKCISYAGSPYPKNTTRAQLPCRSEFNCIKDDEIFLFLGYDVENDLFVCWDPIKVKSRLNKKKYVSFFCRQNVQDSVQEGNVVEANLTNGDVYVLFKRCDISRFFEMIEVHFKELSNDISSQPIPTTSELQEDNFSEDVSDADLVGKLSNLNDDPIVRAFVDQLVSQGKRPLQIISECCNTFSSTYYTMLFKEWADIINSYLGK